MFKLLRMDLYRMVRSKSVYVCFAILMVILAIAFICSYFLGTEEGIQKVLEVGMTVEVSSEGEFEVIMDHMDTLSIFREGYMDGGMYSLILGVVAALFVCVDFQGGFIKNIMASHRDRWKYIGSKLICIGILNLCYTVLGFGVDLLINLLLGGLFPFTNWVDSLFYLSWAWLLTTALAALIIMICVITRSVAAGVMAAVLFGSGVLVVAVSSLMNFFHMGGWAEYTIYFNLASGSSGYSSTGDLRMFIVGVVFLVIYSAASMAALTKQDI